MQRRMPDYADINRQMRLDAALFIACSVVFAQDPN